MQMNHKRDARIMIRQSTVSPYQKHNPFAKKGLLGHMLATLLLLNLALTFSFGQNLITNGDFETGSFSPWIATGNTAINSGVALQGQFSCSFGFDQGGANSGKIEQTLATEIGTVYYLSIQALDVSAGGSITLAGTPAAGGPADGTNEILNASNGGGTHYTLFFTASSNSTKVSILVAGGFLADNIKLVALPPHPKAGRYAGIVKSRLTSEENELAITSSSKVVARLKATGQIVLLRGGIEVGAGIILPDDTMSIRIGDRLISSEATFRGSKLVFTLPPLINALDEGKNLVDADLQTTFTLTRVGR
jgi:hypothetical protein